MRRTRPVALLAAGSATSSALLRNAGMAGAIGPVKSTYLRVASRLVNALRCGHAVDSFDEFSECRLIVAVAPSDTRETLLRELRSAGGLDLAHKVLVQAGTAEARRLLQTLAAGAPDAPLTHAAKGGLERLDRGKE